MTKQSVLIFLFKAFRFSNAYPGGISIYFICNTLYDYIWKHCIWNLKCQSLCTGLNVLTHWGRVTHICVSKLTIIGSDNGLSPGRRQAIIWTNAGILLIGPIRTNFNEIFIEINIISFKKIHLKMSSGKWRPSCLGLNVFNWLLHYLHVSNALFTCNFISVLLHKYSRL